MSYISDCCGVEMNGHDIDYGICPDCHDHCEAIDEEEENEEEIGFEPEIDNADVIAEKEGLL